MINKIYNENNIVTMERMTNNFIDAIVTSPPYDNLMEYNGYTFDWKNTLNGLYRITKDGGVVVWVVGDATIKGTETGTSFRQALYAQEIGFNLHDTMIWHKTNPMPSFKAKRYNQAFEYMFIFSKGEPKTFNPLKEKCKTAGQLYTSVKKMNNRKEPERVILKEPKRKAEEKNLYNVWSMGHAARSYGHPAVFPEPLVERQIQTWTNVGDVVYDPFMGSGTTAVVAKRNNRNYIGSEISKEYCDIINTRLEAVKEEKQTNQFFG